MHHVHVDDHESVFLLRSLMSRFNRKHARKLESCRTPWINCPMPVDTDLCWSKLWNWSQCWSIPINVDQFQSMSTNSNQCRPIPINVDQFKSMSINSNQCRSMRGIETNWWALIDIDWHLGIDRGSPEVIFKANLKWSFRVFQGCKDNYF